MEGDQTGRDVHWAARKPDEGPTDHAEECDVHATWP
jgi:hypothetical protein